MFFVQKRLRLVWIASGPGRREKSMNRGWIGKTKFAAQFHVDPKQKVAKPSYGKPSPWQKMITSKVHRSVK
jgi:hypothetical protein